MNKPLIFLDLDRTLYRTAAAGRAKWQKISQNYPQIDASSEHARQGEFYKYSGDMYAYDFSEHVAAVGLDVAAVYQMLTSSELADGRLEYEGAAELVEWARNNGVVKVLTYGTDDYQRLKAALCPSLKGIEVVTVLSAKGVYLEDKGDAWLVDDRPLGDELPENVRFIQVCLEGQVPPAEAHWPVARSLHEVLELIQSAQDARVSL